MNNNGDYSEDENIFDIIGRELDEREEEARREQQQQQQMGNIAVFSQSGHEDEVDFLPMGNEWNNEIKERRDETPNNDSSRNQIEAADSNAARVPKTISKRRREHSVVKSTTPRFSFQSSVKSTSTARHSMSSTLLSPKSEKQSKKRKHRHSFRQSIDRNASKDTSTITQINNNMRELGFAPKFLTNARPSSFTNDDDIGEGNDGDALTKRKWNRLTSSQAAITSPHKQSSSSRRNKSGGYLIQSLRSLRNNDQRMAMRLRASSGGYSTAPMSSKRRRSSGGGTGSSMNLVAPKQVASELDVTVMNAAVPNQNADFGVGKMRLAYIRRYTGEIGCKFPCYSWIVLPHLLNEKSIGDGGGGGVTQLRCYDAIIIPPRVASISAEGQPIPLNGLKEYELPLPTIICANVCEQCPNDMTALHDVPFDMLAQYMQSVPRQEK